MSQYVGRPAESFASHSGAFLGAHLWMLGYVPAPPTTVDAPLTQSGARRGSIRESLSGFGYGLLRFRELIDVRGGPIVPRIGAASIVPLNVNQRRRCGRTRFTKINYVSFADRIAALVPLNSGPMRERHQFFYGHLLSPDRWLRSKTILPHSLFEIRENARIHWSSWRSCNAKINCLTRFSTSGVHPENDPSTPPQNSGGSENKGAK